jgi:transposase-like protein
MYWYADRLRAVQLYIKLGKRMAPTLRQLGYPTKNALKAWHREYERHRDLPAGYVRSRPWYSDAQRQVAVEHYLSHGRCLTYTRKALGYPCRATLLKWINQHESGGRRRVVGKAVAVPRTEPQKQAAVIDQCSRQESAREVAQEVGVSRQTLYK